MSTRCADLRAWHDVDGAGVVVGLVDAQVLACVACTPVEVTVLRNCACITSPLNDRWAETQERYLLARGDALNHRGWK